MRNMIFGVAVGAALVASAGAVWVALEVRDSAPPASTPGPAATATPARAASPSPGATSTPTAVTLLTGEPVSASEEAARRGLRPVAVMMDNAPGAFPHSGLDQADIVIEALVEGGITRFFAVFHSKDAARIEPVRSARTPFLYWALEYDALYAHVGSSDTPGDADASGQMVEWGVADLDMDGVAFAAYFRDPDRSAPHNAVTSTAELRVAAKGRGYDHSPRIEPWRFRGSAAVAGGVVVPSVRVKLAQWSTTEIRWDWDPASGRYLRWQDGEPHVEADSRKQLAFANVVVVFAAAEVVDESGHVLMETLGQGDAVILTGGQFIRGTWRKPTREARTRFYALDGVEVRFAPGPTWIEVVDTSGVVQAR